MASFCRSARDAWLGPMTITSMPVSASMAATFITVQRQ
jgi:hypothetical protein